MAEVSVYSLKLLRGLFDRFCDNAAPSADAAASRPAKIKHHIDYLDEYMTALGCQTVVVEDQYLDRNFMEDFAAYHVRAFHPYRRHCARLHFFDRAFEADAFLDVVAGAGAPSGGDAPAQGGSADVEAGLNETGLSEAALQDAYLGFVVIKPLPSTIVGRTCLKAYGDAGKDKRLYPVRCKERVNLYGIDLSVQTLPFQEQDRDVAACASSALWSVFHATGRRFQHAIPSPVQITAAATQRSGYEDRVLPNGNGLTARQMADAIRSVGLEPFTVSLTRSDKASAIENQPDNRMLRLKIAAAAYLRAGIPCVLLARMHEGNRGKPATVRGDHAVALAGYRVGTDEPAPYGKTGILFAAARTSKLYAHDDQVGPFARMEFVDDGFLQTYQMNKARKRLTMFAEPRTLMVPLYHKIRIPFNHIVEIAIAVDDQINVMRNAVPAPKLLEHRIVWDLNLRTLNEYRAEIRETALGAEAKRRLLTGFMPRFLWQLSAASRDGTRLFDLLFDPTDLLQGRLFLDAVVFDEDAIQFVASALALVGPDIWPELPLTSLHNHFKGVIDKAAA